MIATENVFDVPDFLKIDITPYIEYARFIAQKRHEQKKNYSSCNPMSPNYEVVGVLGEIVYQIQLNESFDHRLLVNGDDGYDFSNYVNVKASEEFKAQHLIEYTNKESPNIYVFVKINLEKKYGYIYSWIFGHEFDKISEIRDFGYGNRKSILLEQMRPYYMYPPYINKIISDLHKSQFVLEKYNKKPMNSFIETSKKYEG